MRNLIFGFVVGAIAVCTTVASNAAPNSGTVSVPPLPARSAFDRSSETGQGCIDGRHMLAHAAYVRAADQSALRCGHLLSTDTLMKVHRWDRT